MAGYIYLPVPTAEMLDFCNEWLKGQKLKGKSPYVVLYNQYNSFIKGVMRQIGFGVLSDLKSNDILYILSHGGAKGSSFIGAKKGNVKTNCRGVTHWEGGILKKYSPQELASLLKKEKLPMNFVDLRVYCCGSALVPDKSGVDKSYAQRLAIEMRKIGYANVKITGYLGSVRSSYAIRQIPFLSEYTTSIHKGVEIDGKILPASTKKVIY